MVKFQNESDTETDRGMGVWMGLSPEQSGTSKAPDFLRATLVAKRQQSKFSQNFKKETVDKPEVSVKYEGAGLDIQS